jgi:integrase
MSDSEPKKPRYVVPKPQKGGHTLWYWQPSKSLERAGFKTVPLSRNRAEAYAQAEALNQQVDKWRGGMPVLEKNRHGTIPWIIDVFKQSPRWSKLRPHTINNYQSQFCHILRWSAERGDPPMRTFTRRDAEQLWASMQARTPTMAEMVIIRCAMLWNYAMDLDEDVVARNPFRRLGLPKQPSRAQVWQPGQIAAVIEKAIAMGKPSLALAVMIAINTAQRPSDICALKWSQYDGRVITLTQIKTGATVTIPVTPELKVALDDAKRARAEGKVVALAADGPIVENEYTRRAWEPNRLAIVFRQVCRDIGSLEHLQLRDMRRTATTQLAEAGCTPHQIAAIGGWTLETVGKMMAVYGKVNITMAESAIAKLEAYRAAKGLLEV